MKTLLFLLFACSFLFSQQDTLTVFNLNDPIVVSASRLPSALWRTARTVTVLDSLALSQLPVNSLQEALGYIAGVDVQQRGSQGIQADVRLRGTNYEQVLILLDGTPMNDPQSGHHNANLPVTLNDVERIEVLKGAGSRLYGPSAMGGVINIITRKARKKRLNLSLIGGDYAYWDGNLALAFQTAKMQQSLTIHHSQSSGYRHNTDFRRYTISYKNRMEFKQATITLATGLTDKNFGANRFYHPSFADQRERTRVFYVTTAATISAPNKAYSLSPKIFWRHHIDRFWLDYNRPDWYHNKHRTDVFGLEILGHFTNRFGNTALQLTGQLSKLQSNRLGNHQRPQLGLSAEHQATWRAWQLVFGSAFYYYHSSGWQICPGIDLSFQATQHLILYLSMSKGFRLPSYTERFYFSPANHGNPQLKPEQSKDFEIGSRFFQANMHISLALFRRFGTNLIDWIYETDGHYWQALNIANMTTDGLEFSYSYRLQHSAIQSLNVTYAYLTSDKTRKGVLSKYVLNYLRHQLIIGIRHKLGSPHILVNWQWRLEDRVNTSGYARTDVRVQWQAKKWQIFANITNLFNRKYEDFTAVPLPGRWFKVGITYALF